MVLRDLESFEPEAVFKSGKCVFEEMDAAGVWSGVMGERVAADGRDIPEDCNVPDAPLFPAHFYHSVRCKKAEPGDFTLRVDVPCAAVRVNVMKIRTFGTFTEQAVRTLPVKDGEICWEGSGLTLAASFERYGKNGNISLRSGGGRFYRQGRGGHHPGPTTATICWCWALRPRTCARLRTGFWSCRADMWRQRAAG